MKYEPYRSYADRFNVYALCTASESTFDNGGSTFFDVIIDKYNSPVMSNNLHGSQWKNHIFERCIGPEFIEKIHDAHIEKSVTQTQFRPVRNMSLIMFTITLRSLLWL